MKKVYKSLREQVMETIKKSLTNSRNHIKMKNFVVIVKKNLKIKVQNQGPLTLHRGI